MRVLITTFDRPGLLKNLLNDLIVEKQKHKTLHVSVYDDNSTLDYSEITEILAEQGWDWWRAEVNHGRVRYCDLVSKMFEDQRSVRGPFIFLADDMRLTDDFVSKTKKQWASIKDKNKRSLRLMVAEERADKPSWTGVLPKDVAATDVQDVGFFDGAAYFTKQFLKDIGFKVPKEIPKRFLPTGMSSGMGWAISTFLHDHKRKMYRVKTSLVSHVAAKSQMHLQERLESTMQDSDVPAHKRYPDTVTASLAAIPNRLGALEQVVASLLPQVDRLNVFLNGWDEVPEFLVQEKVTVARSQDHEDRSDSNKFFWAQDVTGYHLTCDDDIVYPKDYVYKMVQHIESRDRKAIVTLHGRIMKQAPIESFYQGILRNLHNQKAVTKDVTVHIGGTGCMAYHTDTIAVHWDDFEKPDMSDIWMGVLAKDQNVPIVVLRHPVRSLDIVFKGPDTIFRKYLGDDTPQTQVFNQYAPWPLLADPLDANIEAEQGEGLAYWSRQAKLRNALCVTFPEWNSRDHANAIPGIEKNLKRFIAGGFRSGEGVLDVGAGWGRWQNLLEQYGPYKGVDPCKEIVNIAGERGRGKTVALWITSTALPAAKNIFVFDVLSGLTDEAMEDLCAKMRAAVRDRGYTVVVEKMKSDRRDTYRRPESYLKHLPGLSQRGSFKVGDVYMVVLAGRLDSLR